MKNKEYKVLPRIKKYSEGEGVFSFDSLKVAISGDGELFLSSSAILMPDVKTERSSYREANIRVSVSPDFSPFNEYCSLRVTESFIEIHCRDKTGARNAVSVIAQLAKKTESGYVIDCAQIEDWPDAQYRACMVESSGRVWIPMDRIRRYIREMAMCRMNAFMFHFMESDGCTIPLKTVPHLKGYGKENLQYTREEVDAMIAYATSLGIRVIPFVEILTHITDIAMKLDIACPGDTEENLFAICLGQEKTFEAIDTVVGEIAEIFPDSVIHIGADEYDMSRYTKKIAYWDKCPHCKKLWEEKGFKSMREMYFYGLERINEIVNDHSRTMMIWNADLEPGNIPEWLDRNIIIQYYRYCYDLGKEDLYNLDINGYANDGYSVINSFSRMMYMHIPDLFMNSLRLYNWSYRTIPYVNPENYDNVPGGCMCIWEDWKHYKRTAYPAIVLVADRLWNSHTDTVTYDNAYGTAMTKLIFDGRLPEGTNVFACIGDVLPPLKDDVYGEPHKVNLSEDELIKTRDALISLGNDEMAEAYAEAIDWVIEQKKAK